MIELYESGRRLVRSDIAEIESMIGAMLDEGYRDFLLSHNGGIPVPNIIGVSGLPGSPTDVQVFFGVQMAEPTSNIEWNYVALAQNSQRKAAFLPIACDSGGGIFCLRVGQGKTRDVVYFEECSSDGFEYPVASDFRSFTSALED